MPDYDVLVAGGGPVGAAVALAACAAGLDVGFVQGPAARVPLPDPRPIALSHGSRLILERLGAWDGLASPTPIERIHVSQRGGFGRVMLDASEVGLPALGYVTDYTQLTSVLGRTVEATARCHVRRGSVVAVAAGAESIEVQVEGEGVAQRSTARVVAVADGGALLAGRARTRDYGQSVVTARVACEFPHRNVAYERFTSSGPLALLPTGDAMALIWTTGPERALQLCALAEPEFLRELQDAFGGRLGAFREAGARSCFPLTLKVADRITEARVAVLGNAAQTLHPVAGQGLNLGLRDAWEFAGTLDVGAPETIGSTAQLEAYRARRRLDRRGGVGFTDALVRIFSNDLAPVRFARGLGLAALAAFPPARDFLVRRMTFGTRG